VNLLLALRKSMEVLYLGGYEIGEEEDEEV